MKKNKIYVTTMYRWGNKERHSYVIFVGFSKYKAIESGTSEFDSRGGKYSPEVIEFTPDDSKSRKIVYPLKEKEIGE